MSVKHPIISVTGSSGAGTTSVKKTFQRIFDRDGVNASFIDGDAFHRYDRENMKRVMIEESEKGNNHFSHFGPDSNLLEELEGVFRDFGETGTGKTRHYVHDEEEEKLYGTPPGTFSDWEDIGKDTELLFYEGLHGAVVTDEVNVAQHCDLKIGVVPVVNLEWIQKIHRDNLDRGYSRRRSRNASCAGCRTTWITSFRSFHRPTSTFQRVPTVDTSNAFIARWIPTPDESMVVIRFANPRGIDFPYLISMIHDSYMSRANSIVIPGGKLDLAMQLILTPMIMQLMERSRRAGGSRKNVQRLQKSA